MNHETNPAVLLYEKYAAQYDDLQQAIVLHYETILSTMARAFQHLVGTERFLKIEEKLSWLRKAGFCNPHTIWQYLCGYVVVSERPC